MSKVADNPGPVPPIPKEAIDYLQEKRLRPAFSYKDVWGEEHNHAFTIAKMVNLDMLSDMQDSLAAAIAEGKPFRQWRSETEEMLSRRGWWGRKTVTDPKTGEQVEAQLGSSRRLKTIWDVNLKQAYQAGVWERGQKSTSHPYLMYRVGPSKEHRPEHLSWDGLVLLKDDEFWQSHYPPNGWGCKCYTRFVSGPQYNRYLKKGIAMPVKGDARPERTPIKTERPEVKPLMYKNTRTGYRYQGYEGIDPGFEHNSGMGRMAQISQTFRTKDQRFYQTMSPTEPSGSPISDHLVSWSENTIAARQLIIRVGKVIDGVHGIASIPKQEIRKVDAMPFDGAYIASLNRIAIRNMNYPEMALVHEIAHAVDVRGFPGFRHQSRNPSIPEMRNLLARIYESPTTRRLQSEQQSERRDYSLRPQELFAVAYTQWVAQKSGDTALIRQIAEINKKNLDLLRYWEHDEFIPIARAMDELFGSQGWLKKSSGDTP